MNKKNTPAPWRVTRYGAGGAEVGAIAAVAWCGVSSTYSTVAGITQHIDADEAHANACLIAAAPDLLAACEQSLISHSCHGCVACRQIKKAIAKARGEDK